MPSQKSKNFKRWLITGGCGFIRDKSHKKAAFLKNRISIRVLDNLSVGTRNDLAKVCNFKEISVNQIKGEPH